MTPRLIAGALELQVIGQRQAGVLGEEHRAFRLPFPDDAGEPGLSRTAQLRRLTKHPIQRYNVNHQEGKG